LSLFQNAEFDVQEWNKIFKLPLNDLIEGFSTGMKKKTAILGILKLSKQILILDEPFNGLDLETARVIRLIILKLKEQGTTIILTSHILETLTNTCDTICYLKSGKVEFSRTKDEFDTIEKEVFEDLEQEQNRMIEKLL
jgi:ABC-2 type transport system ATP-binding protein